MTAAAKQTGTVSFFDAARGYGFIQPDGFDAEDVYVHRTGLLSESKSLAKDQRVRFDVVATSRGPAAVNVVEAGEGR
jgi:CspA family cold shock protein